jgi:hypothetical protein
MINYLWMYENQAEKEHFSKKKKKYTMLKGPV